MSYAWDITISADTADTSPKEQILKLHKGIITRLTVKFPAGCAGMVKVRLKHAESTIAPLSKKEWLTGDNEDVHAAQYYELTEKPYKLKFQGSSPDTDFDHVITVRAIVLPKEVATFLPFMKLMGKFFKRIGILK